MVCGKSLCTVREGRERVFSILVMVSGNSECGVVEGVVKQF